MPRVRIKNGPAKGTIYEIGDQPLTLGREPTCSIQILDKGASRTHSELFRIGEMCFVRDLNSRNGTFVNDAKIKEEILREGDRIQIGATIIVFESKDLDDKTGEADGSGLEYSEDEVGNTLELRLEDLSVMNVGEGDGSEARRLRAIYRLNRIIADEKDEKSLIDKALPFVTQQLRADCGYLFTRDPQKGNIVPIGTYSRADRKGGKVSRSIIRRAIQEKRALMTSDAMQDNRFSARDSIVMKQIHSVICVPLSVTGHLSGVMYLAADSLNSAFSEEDLELTAAMADQVGLALSHLRIRREQRDLLMSTIRALVRAAEMRDPTARGHSERVAGYSGAIGRQLKLTAAQLDNLQLAALLHDIGKLVVGEDSMYGVGKEKEGEVSADERVVQATLDIIKDMDCFPQIEPAIKYQLERVDGSGPEGLKGEAIPLTARIIAVAKVFDLKANRMAQKSTDGLMKEAVVEIGRQAGRMLGEGVVKALLVAHRDGSLHVPLDQQPASATVSAPAASTVEVEAVQKEGK